MLLSFCPRFKMKCASSYISLPASKLVSPQITVPVFPNSIFLPVWYPFLYARDWCFCARVFMRVHSCRVCPWERDDVRQHKRCISQCFISRPFLAAVCQAARFSLCLSIKPLSRAKGLQEEKVEHVRAGDQFTWAWRSCEWWRGLWHKGKCS